MKIDSTNLCQNNDFSTLENSIAQSIKEKCIDYCYNLRQIPYIKAECVKRNCFFAYEVHKDISGEIDYIKLIPVFSKIKNNKEEAFCELNKLPSTYRAQTAYGYEVKKREKTKNIKNGYYKNKKAILEKFKKGQKDEK